MKSFYEGILLLILSCVMTLYLSMTASALAAPSQSSGKSAAEIIALETRPGVKMKAFLLKPKNPVAVLVLLEGGRGKLKLTRVEGKPTVGRGRGFLARSRGDFAARGLMVALLDAPSDRGFKAMTPSFRISDEYAQDLGEVVSYLNDVTNLPIWLVGMSLGSFSASNGAIRNLEGVDGLVLVSSVTRSAERWPLHDTHPKGILDMGLDKVKVPTLIVAHKGDTCPDTLASRVPEIKGALVHAPKVEAVYFTGGKEPRTNPRSPAPPGCQPLTPHGYYGIEGEAVSAIAAFIKGMRPVSSPP